MNPKDKPRKLSVIIPTSGVLTATGVAVDDGSQISRPAYQPYRSPISPLKHPYRVRTNTRTEMSVNCDELSVQLEPHDLVAADIASPNLLAVADLLFSMKETLEHMTQTFDTIGKQSKRLDSLPREVKRVEDIINAKSELEVQIMKQKAKMQEVRRRLENDVRIALENKLRGMLMTMIHESVEKVVKERVCKELAIQIPRQYRVEPVTDMGITTGQNLPFDGVHRSDPNTPLFSPREEPNQAPKIPVLSLQGPTHEEANSLSLHETEVNLQPFDMPTFSIQDYDSYPPMKIPILLFDESQEHEPPPPSPAPIAGPLRPLLRPLSTPEQSPSYVVHNIPPSRPASSCATPLTAYPGVPAPTPITSEPVIMVFPMRSAPISALSPVLEANSPIASGDIDLLFALSSEGNRELLRGHDLEGFVVPTPMAEWPKTRTIIKTPSLRPSPLMIPSRSVTVAFDGLDAGTPAAPPDTPVLLVPPPRHQIHKSNTLSHNLKSLPPLIIT